MEIVIPRVAVLPTNNSNPNTKGNNSSEVVAALAKRVESLQQEAQAIKRQITLPDGTTTTPRTQTSEIFSVSNQIIDILVKIFTSRNVKKIPEDNDLLSLRDLTIKLIQNLGHSPPPNLLALKLDEINNQNTTSVQFQLAQALCDNARSEGELCKALSDVQWLREEVETLQKELAEIKSEKAKIETELIHTTSERQNLQDQIKSLTQNNNSKSIISTPSTSNELSACLAQNTRLMMDLTTSNATQARLEEEIRRAKEDKKLWEEEREHLERQIEQLTRNHGQLTEQLRQVVAEVDSVAAKDQKLGQQLANVVADKARLETELELTRKQLEATSTSLTTTTEATPPASPSRPYPASHRSVQSHSTPSSNGTPRGSLNLRSRSPSSNEKKTVPQRPPAPISLPSRIPMRSTSPSVSSSMKRSSSPLPSDSRRRPSPARTTVRAHFHA